MGSTLLAWVVGSAAGVLVMSLPERGDRVFSLSAAHGPSVVDLIGVGLLAAVGLGVLWVSIAGDTGREWLVGVALLVLGQLVAVRVIEAGAAR
jgi:hypothetical protein